MSKVVSAVFAKGAVRPIEDAPFDLRGHIAFMGRSNVGKSTLLNALCHQKHLARSSSKPGKTTEINFFLINNKKYFVDLPGYGYAKQPKDVREKIETMIHDYLFESQMPIERICLLVDSNVGPTVLDQDMFEQIVAVYEPGVVCVVANKIDKVPRSQRKQVLSRIEQLFPGAQVLGVSSKEFAGLTELLTEILPK